MYCGKCGREIPDESKYCPECGSKIPELKSVKIKAEEESKASNQEKNSKKADKIILIAVVILLLLLVCIPMLDKQNDLDKLIGTWYRVEEQSGAIDRAEEIVFYEPKDDGGKSGEYEIMYHGMHGNGDYEKFKFGQKISLEKREDELWKHYATYADFYEGNEFEYQVVDENKLILTNSVGETLEFQRVVGERKEELEGKWQVIEHLDLFGDNKEDNFIVEFEDNERLIIPSSEGWKNVQITVDEESRTVEGEGNLPWDVSWKSIHSWSYTYTFYGEDEMLLQGSNVVRLKRIDEAVEK